MKKVPAGYTTVRANLLPGHCRKLADGESCTLKHHMIGSGIPIVVHHTTAKKMMTAHRAGKGHRLRLSPEEVALSEKMMGGKVTWKSFKKGLSKGWQYYKKNLASALGPLLKKGLTTLSSYAGSQLGPEASVVGDTLIKELGKTGLYGDQAPAPAPAAAAPIAETPVSIVSAPVALPAPAAATTIATTTPIRKSRLQGGRIRKRKTTRRALPHYGSGLFLQSPSYGHGLYAAGGLYASGGALYPPSNFIPYSSPVMSRLVDIGNAQWGQNLIPIPL